MRSAPRTTAVWGCLALVAVLSGCGGATGASTGHGSTTSAKTDPPAAQVSPPAAVKTATEKKTSDGRVEVAEVADPEEAKSFPTTSAGAIHHKTAKTPAKAGAVIAAGAPSDAEVQSELNEMHAVEHTAQQTQRKELTPVPGGESVGGNGTITPPAGIPAVVARVIAGGNAIADFPYVFGGGHGSFVDNAYDCSGSVSYALAAGGLLSAPLVSGDLAHWGEPGPGRWITIYANAGHTFMDVDGMWFDTAGRSGPYASRWLVAQPPLEGYAVRHPQGL
jgi:cell wall-associated NlpC family hydrolase